MRQSPAAQSASDPTHLQAHGRHCADASGLFHRLRRAVAAADAQMQPHVQPTLDEAAPEPPF